MTTEKELIVDTSTGTVLSLEDCRIVDEGLLSNIDELSDSQIAELADTHGETIVSYCRTKSTTKRRSIYAPRAEHGGKYLSLDQIRNHNNDIGHHWFSPKTMRFFSCRVLSVLHLGRFFISSEADTYSGRERRYTIREALQCGCIETVGEFQQYDTARQAKKALLAIDPATPERECYEHKDH